MTCRKVDSIIDLIGQTPLIRVSRMCPNPNVELYVKLESMNPGGSVKDRIGLSMIEAAEASGELVPGKVVLEASSGNTAIGLAMVCAVKGYKLAVTMSESASEERKKILRAYGAKIILTPGHLATDGAIEEAYRLAREYPDQYVLVDQFNNEANWRAHYDGTGKEIWEATDGKVDVVVITMGTTGTLMGNTRILKELNPNVRVVGVEPFKGHKLQGLKNMKESYPPGIFEPSVPDAIVNIEDEPAYEMARRLAREEGIFVGMSAGAAMKVAMDEAEKLDAGVVVALLADGGERYLSTSLFESQTVPEPLKLYNTLSRQVEDFRPATPGKVTVYSCGPSLDGPPDLGLCRRLVFADMLRRYLEYRGYEVKHGMIIADIDDRVVNECLASGEPLADFTGKWEEVFFRTLDELGVKRAHLYPKASEHVNDMIDQTRALLERGLAYEKLRSVYYSIKQFPEYGRLSGVDLEAVHSEKSTVYDYYEKDNPRDFALFKRTTLPELKAGIYWTTPWGNARPGWHVECATVIAKLLGQPIDIHTASTDLVFPHGDNEIAIAQGLTGKPLANCWLHSEVVMTDGKKISRRAGNDLTADALLTNGIDGKAVRYWLLTTHYRTALNYRHEDLVQASRAVQRLNDFVLRLSSDSPGEATDQLDQLMYEARTAYHEAMDQDLNLPRGMGHIFSFVRKVNRLLDQGHLDADERERVLSFLKGVNEVVAVIDFEPEAAEPRIQELVLDREQARTAGEFSKADSIRTELDKMGIQLFDTPTGTRWRRA